MASPRVWPLRYPQGWPELGESEQDGLPDPPETPTEREYRLWREYCEDYELSHEELHDDDLPIVE
jgi:hypothetical protein